MLLEIRTDWSPSKFEFGKFGASNFSERLEPSIRRDGDTPRYWPYVKRESGKRHGVEPVSLLGEMENLLQMWRLLSSTPVLGIALQPLYFTLL